MDNRGILAGNLLLNVAVILAGFGLALIWSVRHAHWGPEGPVGAWLILVPYVFITAAVIAVFQERMNAEFRALGKDAPLWKYLGYMYISNELLRNECHEIVANRADRDASLSEYLGNEMLAMEATRYIGEFHPAPGPVLAPAFALRSDLPLSGMAEIDAGQDKLSDRSYSDIRDLIRAAVRIQKGGGDLAPQMLAWRNYLKKFKNAAELVAEIDKALPPLGTR